MAAGSRSRGVMSLNTIPGFGKSGMSRIRSRRSTAATSYLAGDLAQVADEEQVLEVRGHGGEVLERLDRLLALLGIARAQRRAQELLEQRRLAVRRRAEHAQVAPADAMARQLGHGPDDLPLGLVVIANAAAVLALDHAVLLELAHELGLRARLLDHVLDRVQRAAFLDRHRRAAQSPPVGAARALRRLRIARSAGRELLADHAQGKELVALKAQDRAQPRHVAGRVEPVAPGRALG